MVGRTLAHYVILEKIGAGGMGVVYRARDTRLDRSVALKVVSEQTATGENARARLLREAKTASALNHPNICTIHEVGEADGETFIAMELVDGQPLNALISSDGLPVETVIRYAIQIADALSHAHERGVVHRDLKSWNVIVTPEGRPKVLDFGLAKRAFVGSSEEATRTAEQITQAGTLIGTLSHMAPELLRGEPADTRTDLWALGVLLYHALTGSLPFQGSTSFQISSAILRDSPAPLPPRVPPGLAAIIQRLLAKQPADRYQRASEVRAALEAVQSATTPNSAMSAAPRSVRSWIWAAVTILILAVAGILAWPRIQSWRTPASASRLSDGSNPSKNSQANEYYERALQFGPNGPRQDLTQERKLLERALEMDPKFAAARAEHAFTLVTALLRGDSNDPASIYKGEEELRQALQDDPACGRVHSVLALTYLLSGHKDLIPGEVEKSLQTNPNDVTAYSWLAFYYQLNGDYAQAAQQARLMNTRWPLYWPGHLSLSAILMEQGDVAGSIREAERVLEQDPHSIQALSLLSRSYIELGDIPKARRSLDRAPAEAHGNYRLREYRALLLALEGKKSEALQEMDSEVLAYAGIMFRGPVMTAEFYAVLGDTPNALDWMDRAVRMGDDRTDWFRRDVLLARLQGNPRFQQILASVVYRQSQRPPATGLH